MPFIALNNETKQRIDITEIDNPREELRGKDLVCQLCGQRMIVKAGPIVKNHFAHEADCESEFEEKRETPEHQIAKRFISEQLKKLFSPFICPRIALEVPIHSIKRIADILIIFPMGFRIAHEIQLSRIGVESLNERTEDYFSAGIDVYWWLGASLCSQALADWSTSHHRRNGYLLEIDLASDVSVKASSFEKNYNIRKVSSPMFPSPKDYRFVDKMLKLAFVRYLEIWTSGTLHNIVEGMGGMKDNKKINYKVNGFIGAANDKGRIYRVNKDKLAAWQLTDISLFDEDGISPISELARAQCRAVSRKKQNLSEQ